MDLEVLQWQYLTLIGLVWHCDGAVFTHAEERAENRAMMGALVGGISLYLYVRILSNQWIRKKRLRGML